MPYIGSYKKQLIDELIPKIEILLDNSRNEEAKDNLIDYGAFEYLIFKLMCNLTKIKPNFSNMNSLVGIMETTKLEYRDKILGPYEDSKLLEEFLNK